MTRFGEIFLWLWLVVIGAVYAVQFKDYAAPVARLVLGLGP